MMHRWLFAVFLVLGACSSPPPPLQYAPVYVDEPAMRPAYERALERINAATGLELYTTDDPNAPVRAYRYDWCTEAAACGVPLHDHYAIYYRDAEPSEGLIMHEHIHQLAIATNAEHLPPGNVFASRAGGCLTAEDLVMICRVRECTHMTPEVCGGN